MVVNEVQSGQRLILPNLTLPENSLLQRIASVVANWRGSIMGFAGGGIGIGGIAVLNATPMPAKFAIPIIALALGGATLITEKALTSLAKDSSMEELTAHYNDLKNIIESLDHLTSLCPNISYQEIKDVANPICLNIRNLAKKLSIENYKQIIRLQNRILEKYQDELTKAFPQIIEERNNLLRENGELIQRIGQVENELVEKTEEIKQLKEKIQQIETNKDLQLDESQRKLAKVQEERDSFKNQLKELTEKFREQLEIQRKLEKNVQIRIGQLENELAEKKEEIKQLKEKIKQIETNKDLQLDEVYRKLAKVQEERDSFKNQLKELTEKFREQLENQRKLQETVQSLAEERKNWEIAQDQKFRNMEAKLLQMMQENQSLHLKNTELASKPNAEVSAEMVQFVREAAAYCDLQEKAVEIIDHATRTTDGLVDENNKLREENRALKAQLKSK